MVWLVDGFVSKKVKVKQRIAVSGNHLAVTGNHMLYGITQCPTSLFGLVFR